MEKYRHTDPRSVCGRILLAMVAGLILLALGGCQSPQLQPVSGADGIGDTYYPQLGNGGYDAQKYTVILQVDPPTNTISGETQIEAQALERLKSFNLDFVGLSVDSVVVNNSQAAFARQDQELMITPEQALRSGTTFVTGIRYHGQPDDAESITARDVIRGVGWFHSKDGTINVLSEPNGASTWYPVNDHPRDKASYRFEITVPKPWIVAATGMQKETVDEGNRTRYVFEMDEPMASYLASIDIDRYTIETSQGPDGLTIRNYFPSNFTEDERKGFRSTREMMAYYVSVFGPFPFHEYGVVVVDSSIPPCNGAVGGALETQTLTTICPKLAGSESDIAHELAHQWFGDSVSLTNWQDVWLKEGIATYAEWLWKTRNGGMKELHQLAIDEKNSLFFTNKIGQPPPEELYSWEQYVGGALTVHALRLQVGDEAFFKILRTYLERYRYSNASAQDFISLSEEISGQKLSPFFDSWLLGAGVPDLPEPRK